MNTKLGKPTDQKLALVSNLATDLLWYGRIETTFERAKAAARLAEKWKKDKRHDKEDKR